MPLPLPPEARKQRARIASLTRSVRVGERTQAELDQARRDFNAAKAGCRAAVSDEYLQAWVAEQVARFEPSDLDRGIEILRRHLAKGHPGNE